MVDCRFTCQGKRVARSTGSVMSHISEQIPVTVFLRAFDCVYLKATVYNYDVELPLDLPQVDQHVVPNPPRVEWKLDGIYSRKTEHTCTNCNILW